jgi:hypothetical protein
MTQARGRSECANDALARSTRPEEEKIVSYGSLQESMTMETGGGVGREVRAGTLPYLGAALPIGVIGAAAVAIFAFVLDTLAGRPLATPNALGATLFHGAPFDLAAPIQAGYVFAYTLMHGALFCIAAAGAVSAEATLSRQGVSLNVQFVFGAVGLFLGLLASFLLMASLSEIRWSADFGVGRILASNVIGAVAMATAIHQRAVAKRPEA